MPKRSAACDSRRRWRRMTLRRSGESLRVFGTGSEKKKNVLKVRQKVVDTHDWLLLLL